MERSTARDGLPRPGVLVLERILYSLLASDPRHTDTGHRVARLLAQHAPLDPPWRLWFRFAHGDVVTYFSTSPGETRTEQPDGPFDIVRDLPAVTDIRPVTARFREVVAAAADDESPEVRRLVERAREVLDCTDPARAAEQARRFEDAIVSALFAPGASLERARAELYEWSFRIGVVEFARIVFDLDLLLAVRPPEARPIRARGHEMVEARIRAHPELHDDFVGEAVRLGNLHFETAERMLSQALASTGPRRFYRLLHRANQQYASALLPALSETVAATGALEYRASRVEEGLAVCATGLWSGIDEMLAGLPVFTDDAVRAELAVGGPERMRAYLRTISRWHMPTLPQVWARIVGAEAMLDSGTWVEEAIEMLNAAATEIDLTQSLDVDDGATALDRLYGALIRGHLMLGDEAGARQCGIRLARDRTAAELMRWMRDEIGAAVHQDMDDDVTASGEHI